VEAELPTSFYTVLGVLIFMSAGSLISGIVMLVKVALWIGEFKQKISRAEQDINAAHSQIRELKNCKEK